MSYNILTAVPTAFNRAGDLDLPASRDIFRYVARSGNEGAFVLGTTGEFPAVDDAEFEAIVGAAVEDLAPHMRLIVHVGQPSAYEAVRRVQCARALGAREFAALTPYYLVSTKDVIFEYFERVAEAVGDGRLYVYIYPARSGNAVSPDLLARLATIPGIVGAKISELSLADIAAYRAAVPEGFELYTGADRDLIAAGDVGAQGVISGVSSVVPAPFRDLADAARAGDAVGMAAAQLRVDDVVNIIGGDMARMKEGLRRLEVADCYCRMAIALPTEAERREVDRVIDAYAAGASSRAGA